MSNDKKSLIFWIVFTAIIGRAFLIPFLLGVISLCEPAIYDSEDDLFMMFVGLLGLVCFIPGFVLNIIKQAKKIKHSKIVYLKNTHLLDSNKTSFQGKDSSVDVVDVHILESQVDQKMFEILQEFLPNNWEQVVFFAGYYNNNSGYFQYWVKLASGEYVDCFSLVPEPKSGEKDVLQEQLMKLHKEMQNLRLHLPPKQLWVCMEMTISNNGKLSKKYDYADGVEKDNLQEFVEDYQEQLREKFN